MTFTTRVSNGICLLLHATRNATISSILVFVVTISLTMSYIALYIPNTLCCIQTTIPCRISFYLPLFIEIFSFIHTVKVQRRMKGIYERSYDEKGRRNGYRKVPQPSLTSTTENGIHINEIRFTKDGGILTWRNKSSKSKPFEEIEGTPPNAFLRYLSASVAYSIRTWVTGKAWWHVLQWLWSLEEEYAHNQCPWICWTMIGSLGKVVYAILLTLLVAWEAFRLAEPLMYAVYDSGFDVWMQMLRKRSKGTSIDKKTKVK